MTGVMADTARGAGATETVAALAGLAADPSSSPDYVGFRVALLEAQLAAAEALERAAPAPPPGPTRQRAGDGTPALGPEDVAFDCGLLESLLGVLATALDGHGGGEVLERLASVTAREPGLLEAFACAAAFGPQRDFLDSVGRRLGTHPDGLLLYGRALAAPFVRAAVQVQKTAACVEPAALERCGRCPYCGSAPGLAMLRRSDGRRVLFCPLCGEHWLFARMACPFCGRQGALEVLSTGPDEPRWNEVCPGCRAYLKTTDERRLSVSGRFMPLVEATATLYLDLLAEQHGCRPGLPYCALQ